MGKDQDQTRSPTVRSLYRAPNHAFSKPWACSTPHIHAIIEQRRAFRKRAFFWQHLYVVCQSRVMSVRSALPRVTLRYYSWSVSCKMDCESSHEFNLPCSVRRSRADHQAYLPEILVVILCAVSTLTFFTSCSTQECDQAHLQEAAQCGRCL
jgi:hypothetical protein